MRTRFGLTALILTLAAGCEEEAKASTSTSGESTYDDSAVLARLDALEASVAALQVTADANTEAIAAIDVDVLHYRVDEVEAELSLLQDGIDLTEITAQIEANTEAISAINATEYLVAADLPEEPDLTGYLTAADLPDLTGYLTAADLPDLTGYLTAADLPDLTGYLTAADLPDLTGYLTADDLPDLTGYLTAEDLPDLSGFLTADELPEEPDLSGVESRLDTVEFRATANEGNITANSERIVSNMSTIETLRGTLDRIDLSAYLTATDLPDLSGYLTAEDLPDLRGYLTAEDLPDLSGYLTAEDLPDLSPVTDSIALNAAGITSNATEIASTKAGVSVNTENLFSLGTKVSLLENDVDLHAVESDYLTDVVAGHDADLASLQMNVELNSASIDDNAVSIVDNAASIVDNAVSIDSNTVSIDSNTVSIDSNTVIIASNAEDIATISTEIDDIESIPGLAAYVSVDETTNTVLFSGANVQVVSGAGAGVLDDNLNGLGNLIIGYNLGRHSWSDEETVANRMGAHNLVIGLGNAYTDHYGIVHGFWNESHEKYAATIGGEYNDALGPNTVTIGGAHNTVSAENSVSIAGQYNAISGQMAVMLGGTSLTCDATGWACAGNMSVAGLLE